MKKRLLFIMLFVIETTSTIKTEGKPIKLNNEQIPKINYVNLYNTILSLGILYPDIVFAQAVLESGSFKSNLTILNNNIFGMRYPSIRETTAIGKGKSGYAKYETWVHSVEDYLHWQEFLFSKRGELSKTEYFAYLKRWYAKDKNYVIKVKEKIKEYKHITG
jgi:flagellum-specific peptidoglycan hydrolase FlgJ